MLRRKSFGGVVKSEIMSIEELAEEWCKSINMKFEKHGILIF